MLVKTRSFRRASSVFVVCTCCYGSGALPSASAQEPGALRTFPVDSAAPVRRVSIGSGGGVAELSYASVPARLAYSNTLGTFAAELHPELWYADDLTLIAADDCTLRKFSFQVTGRPDPAGCEGGPCVPFSVDFALYDACPGAGGQIIPGTDSAVSFDDDGIYEVSVIIPTDTEVVVPPRVWLGLRMSRAHAGVILGAPALTGFSGDVLDFPGFECNASIGGFPRNPHTSFYAEVYVDAACETGFPG